MLPPPPHSSAYTWRPVARDDAGMIQQMQVANVAVDRLEAASSLERINHLFDMLGETLETDTLTAVTADNEMAAIALVYEHPDEDEHIAALSGDVHVCHRSKGLGTYILNWMEARARQRFSQFGDDHKRQSVRTSTHDHLKDRLTLFESHGFQPVRYSYKMHRDLQMPLPDSALADGLCLVQWSPELNGPMLDAFNDAFDGTWGLPHINEEMWHHFFTGVPQFSSDLTFLAMDGDTVVGFCLSWVNPDKDVQTGMKEGWIEAIGVIPAWRQYGVASALMTHTMRAYAAQGMQRAALDVDTQNPTGALRLYQKLGFETTERKVFYSKEVT